MARLKHKPTVIQGWRLKEPLTLDVPKKPEGVPGDWVLKDHRGHIYLLDHGDVRELYDADDDEAREMLDSEDWPPLRG